MSPTAPPLVQDPVPCDVDDAVIKEAKRRARRRRWSYCGVIAVVLGSAAAFVAWDGTSPPPAPPPAGFVGPPPEGAVPIPPVVGFIGLPPEGTVPSGPTGDLEFHVVTPGKRVWVLADGRMITWRNGPATDAADIAAAATPTASGYLEQHLTPEGVELLRSYLVDSATTITPSSGPPRFESADPQVIAGTHLATVSVPGCHSSEGCPRVTHPETWLPDSAWSDRQYWAFVPTEFDICYGTKESVPVQQVLAAMPPAASKLLTPQQLVPEPTGWALWECVIISTTDARTVDQSFQDAGFQRSDREPPDAINIIKDTQVLHYVFDVPSGAGQTPTVEADVMFQPVFATCSRCG